MSEAASPNLLSHAAMARSRWADDVGSEAAAGDGAKPQWPAGITPVHVCVPGRARLKVAGLHRAVKRCRLVERRLAGQPWVHAVSASELTGNLLVRFDPGVGLHEVAVAISAAVAAGDEEESAAVEPIPAAQAADIRYAGGETPADIVASDASELLTRFGSSPTHGLSAEEARMRLQRHGPNRLPGQPRRSRLRTAVEQVATAPVALLGVSAVLSLLTGALVEAAAVVGVIGINVAIGYVTERRMERTVDALQALSHPNARVLRDGQLQLVKADAVVPGDILSLEAGHLVAADARVIRATGLELDEAALTGESRPVKKTARTIAPEDAAFRDRPNLVHMGTAVTSGTGLALVIGTGADTQLGAIQQMMATVVPPRTPMQRQLDRLGRQLAVLSALVCGGVFAIGLLRGYGFLPMLKSAISLAVAAVPEGLPTVATTTLALGVQNMRRHGILMRHLSAVETMGAVEVMCFDKTGTLTLNRMQVAAVVTPVQRHANPLMPGAGPPPTDLAWVATIVALCNEADLGKEGDPGAVRNGSATESALVRLAYKRGLDVVGLRRRWVLQTTRYRSERRQMMSTLHADSRGRRLLAVKGSPEQVLEHCQWQLVDGRRHPLTAADRAAILAENERMAQNALRVLGVAYALAPATAPGAPDERDLTWLGLVGLEDEMRERMPALMSAFHRAGIRTVMITGDQPATARAVGRRLNLAGGSEPIVVDARWLEEIGTDELRRLANEAHIFARATPADKLRIVQILQQAGKVVAMTGDGVNDGPALRAADIGVALGRHGTDVARSVADVVLDSDDLEAMLAAIAGGRTSYTNIRKSIRFLLATNMTEIMVTFGAITAGLGQPLTPIQLLWINLISDIFPGLALAMEPPDPDVLACPPRDPHAPILSQAELRRLGLQAGAISTTALGAYGYGLARYGPGPQAGTIGLLSLVISQLLHAFSCRSEERMAAGKRRPPNRLLNTSIGLSVAAQAAVALVPGLRNLLGIAPIGPVDWLVSCGAAALPLLSAELVKPPAKAPAAASARMSVA